MRLLSSDISLARRERAALSRSRPVPLFPKTPP